MTVGVTGVVAGMARAIKLSHSVILLRVLELVTGIDV